MKPIFTRHPRHADEWTELIFENRHKHYGAYELRRDYDRRMLQSLLFTATGMLLLFFVLSQLVNRDEPILINVPEKPYETGPVDIAKPVSKPQAPQSQPSPNQKMNSKPVVTNAVDTTNFTRDTATVASHTNTGNNGNNGMNNGGGSSSNNNGNAKVDTTAFANKIIEFPEVMPDYPGGMDAMMRYLSKHIRCQSWQESGESGTVVLSLVINNDGRVTDVSVLRDNVGHGCAEQAAQVVREMPRWSPGRMGERAVSVRYILPVQYQHD